MYYNPYNDQEPPKIKPPFHLITILLTSLLVLSILLAVLL